MKIRRTADSQEDVINASPLIDILFILIIFFLVTASFSQEERDISVNLPETDTTLSSAARVLVVNVREDGSTYLGDKLITLQSLEAALLEAVRTNPDQKVLIRGDREALHGHVAGALAIAKRAGIREANIGYAIQGAS